LLLVLLKLLEPLLRRRRKMIRRRKKKRSNLNQNPKKKLVDLVIYSDKPMGDIYLNI
jgi:hypothetical protein